MSQTLALKQAGQIVLDLVETINANRAYLSEIDGLIGDGDHGINMSKGFTQCGVALRAKPELPGLAEGLDALAMTLLEGIGGSMGPLYGSFFMGLAETLAGKETLDAQLFGEALGLSDEIGRLEPGRLADLALWDWAAGPVATHRDARTRQLHERVFAWMTLGDERNLAATWVAGRALFRRTPTR